MTVPLPRKPDIKPGQRVSGELRFQAIQWVKWQYLACGISIRTISADMGRSFGFVRTLLEEGGVRLRERGGRPGSPRRDVNGQSLDSPHHSAAPIYEHIPVR